MPFDESLIEWDKPPTSFDPSLIKWDEPTLEEVSASPEMKATRAALGFAGKAMQLPEQIGGIFSLFQEGQPYFERPEIPTSSMERAAQTAAQQKAISQTLPLASQITPSAESGFESVTPQDIEQWKWEEDTGSVSQWKPSLKERFRYSSTGRALLGPPEVERAAMPAGAGDKIGLLEIPEALFQSTLIPPQIRKPIEESLPQLAQTGGVSGAIAAPVIGAGVGMASPALPLIPFASLPRAARLAAAAPITVPFLAQAPEAYQKIKSAVDRGEYSEAGRMLSEQGVNAVMALTAPLGAIPKAVPSGMAEVNRIKSRISEIGDQVKRTKDPNKILQLADEQDSLIQQLKERTSDAIQRKTTPVLQPVRPQPVEGLREMPVRERLEEAGKRSEPTPTETGEQPPPKEGTASLGDVKQELGDEVSNLREFSAPKYGVAPRWRFEVKGSTIDVPAGSSVETIRSKVAEKLKEYGEEEPAKVATYAGKQLGLDMYEVPGIKPGIVRHISKETALKEGYTIEGEPAVAERPVEFEEPPKPQGTVRLYRGRSPMGGTAVSSEHFSPNREYARNFAGAEGSVDYVDVPVDKLPKAWEERKALGTGVKYFKLPPEVVSNAKELPIQRKAKVYELETPTGDVPEPKTPTTESVNKSEEAPKPTGPPPTNAATDQDRMIGVHFNEPNGPPQSRALGIVSSITPTFTQAIKTVSENVKNAFPWVREHWRSSAMMQAPKLTDMNRQAGESGVRFASSFFFAAQHGLMFAEKVLDGFNIKTEQFGVALSEDNLRDLRRSYTEEARKLGESGKLDEANQVMEQANAVQTLIGKKNSPFKTEDQYQEFLNRDDVKEAIRRHIQLWKEQKDPMYRKANDLDPETPLATRGLQTGARINLKAIMEGDKPIHGVGLPRFRQLITLKRRDPFARRATGAGRVYEGNYHELMANGFEREMPVATQHEFYKKLIDSGIGKVQSKEFISDLTINGEATKAILLKLNPWRNQWLHVPRSVFEEVKTISGLDQQPQLKVFKKFNDLMTGLSIQGFAEGTTHASNLLTQVFTGLGPTANPMINAVLKSVGRSDLLITLPRVLAKSFSNQREAMLKLAEIGAAKTPYSGRMGWLLNRIDQGVRLVSAENYKQMAEAGWVENTETGLREYVNQVGNYNKRLQPYLIRKLRETGIQPFATAMQTFNIMGVRRMAMAPGAKASSNAAALALRADIAAGWLGTLLIPAMINTLISGKPSGVEGTNIGSIGWRDDKGKLQQIPVLRIAGFERGARITGVLPAIEAYRKGLGHRHAAEAALTAIGGTGMRTVAGPGPEFLYMSATGKRIGLPMIQTAPAAPPTDSMSPFKNQFSMNIQQALIESSPLANSTYDFWHNKDWSEIGKRQFTRFWPTSGMTEEMQRALPKILERKDAVDYGDWLAKQAKKKPMEERAAFVNEQLKKDKVEPRFLKAVYEEVRKKGTYKYQ